MIEGKIAELGRQVDASPTLAPPPSHATTAKGSPGVTGAAGLGAIGLIAWKFKAIALLVLTKGKLLLVGLTKASTFTSMALSLGVYGAVFGWPLALGLVVSIYIHEMGHVAALLRYGVKATAPLFLPGLGAIIRLRQSLGDPRQDARVGLAGPVWGLSAAGASMLVWLAGGPPIWAAIAKLGAAINLFNLIPIGSLDGGRAFHSLDRHQRLAGAGGRRRRVVGLGRPFRRDGPIPHRARRPRRHHRRPPGAAARPGGAAHLRRPGLRPDLPGRDRRPRGAAAAG